MFILAFLLSCSHGNQSSALFLSCSWTQWPRCVPYHHQWYLRATICVRTCPERDAGLLILMPRHSGFWNCPSRWLSERQSQHIGIRWVEREELHHDVLDARILMNRCFMVGTESFNVNATETQAVSLLERLSPAFRELKLELLIIEKQFVCSLHNFSFSYAGYGSSAKDCAYSVCPATYTQRPKEADRRRLFVFKFEFQATRRFSRS